MDRITQDAPDCFKCKHLRESINGWCCDAFPSQIPEDIFNGTFIHDKPYPGDNGIQYEPIIKES